jgi:lipoyl(octanoyl) transferase
MHRVEWKIARGTVEYETAVHDMEARVEAIRGGQAPELAWLVEHPPLYTQGTSADSTELLQPSRFPVHETGRGGRLTYHGPGQRIVYVMLDLRGQDRKPDLRRYVRDLEGWLIDTVGDFGIPAFRREGRVGVWVEHPTRGESKIAALGVRVRHWVTFHGISLNVEPALDHYDGIVPCGIPDFDVTSLVDLGLPVTMVDVDTRLRVQFERRFGPTLGRSDTPQPSEELGHGT